MDFYTYINNELLILIPVLYLIGILFKKSRIQNKLIPMLLGTISIILCFVWILSTSEIFSFKDVCSALFSAFTQGVLIAGASVYFNEISKNIKK